MLGGRFPGPGDATGGRAQGPDAHLAGGPGDTRAAPGTAQLPPSCCLPGLGWEHSPSPLSLRAPLVCAEKAARSKIRNSRPAVSHLPPYTMRPQAVGLRSAELSAPSTRTETCFLVLVLSFSTPPPFSFLFFGNVKKKKPPNLCGWAEAEEATRRSRRGTERSRAEPLLPGAAGPGPS